jgi:hypothetical protein
MRCFVVYLQQTSRRRIAINGRRNQTLQTQVRKIMTTTGKKSHPSIARACMDIRSRVATRSREDDLEEDMDNADKSTAHIFGKVYITREESSFLLENTSGEDQSPRLSK